MKAIPVLNLIIRASIFWIAFSTSSFAGQEWLEWKRTDAPTVYSRPVPGHNEREFKAETIVHLPVDVVGSILTDIEFYQRWVAGCREVSLLQGMEARDCIARFVIRTIWPAPEIEMIFHIQTTLSPDLRKIIISGTALPDYPQSVDRGYMRVRDADFSIILEGPSPNSTRMTTTTRTNIHCALPAVISEYFSGRQLFLTLINFKEVTKFPGYHRILARRDEFQKIKVNSGIAENFIVYDFGYYDKER